MMIRYAISYADPSVISLSFGSLVDMNPKIMIAEITVKRSCMTDISICLISIIYVNKLINNAMLKINSIVNIIKIFLSFSSVFLILVIILSALCKYKK